MKKGDGLPPLDGIPQFLRLTPEERKAGWTRYDAEHPASQQASKKEAEPMAKSRGVADQIAKLRTDRASNKKIPAAAKAATAKKIVAATEPKIAVTGNEVTVAEAALPKNDETTKTPPASAEANAKPTADAAAQTQESKMKSSASQKKTATAAPKRSLKEANANMRKAKGGDSKTKATANARKPVKSSGPAVPEPGSMAEKIGKLASRENGASRAELIKLTDWKQQAWKWYFHNSKDNGFCQKFGYTLKVIEGDDGESRYKITKK